MENFFEKFENKIGEDWTFVIKNALLIVVPTLIGAIIVTIILSVFLVPIVDGLAISGLWNITGGIYSLTVFTIFIVIRVIITSFF